MNKKSLSLIAAAALVLASVPKAVAFADTTAPASTYAITYEGHVQNIGWQTPVTVTGDQTDITKVPEAGTDGRSLRVEAIKIAGVNLPQGASITYEGHVQNIGWQKPVTVTSGTSISNAPEAGTHGQSLRVEALKLTLNGMPGYAIKYQGHVQNVGWQTPVISENGTPIETAPEAGTHGRSLRVEALRIEIVKTDTEKNAEVAAIKAVAKATSTKAAADIQTATTAVQAVQDSIENKALNYSLSAITGTAKTGYVNNPELQYDLKVRSAPNLSGSVIGYLYNYQKVQILDTVTDSSGNTWDKITYNGSTAYVNDSYIQLYTSPSSDVVSVASNITKQFEVGTGAQIAGNFDGQGLSLGYLQWCIGQNTLQPLLNRMDRQYNSEMKSIFGTNYDTIHNMTLDTLANQLKWAQSINDSSNNIAEPWYSQFVSLYQNQDFISIEKDAEVYKVKQAMLICDKYNLKTVRGFALAFDIVNQNGSLSPAAATVVDAAVKQNPGIAEKSLISVIANAVADTSPSNNSDIRARKTAIANGQGTVHGIYLYLDRDYGLSDNAWR